MKKKRKIKKPMGIFRSLNETNIPSLPKNRVPIAMYRSNEYLNVVCLVKDRIEFHLWDEYSPYYNRMITFDTIPLPSKKKKK